MDFGLSEEQELLQRTAREFLEQECPTTFVREVIKDKDGLGLKMLDMALLLEEMGRAASPGPFLFSSVLATLALLQGGTGAQKKTWLPRLVSGESLGSVALLEPSDRLDPTGVTTRAKKTRDGYRLAGSKEFVPYAQVADFLIVPFRTSGRAEEGISLFLIERGNPGAAVKPLEIFDLTRRSYEVTFDDVLVAPEALLGGEGKGWKVLARLLDAGCVALAADSLGGAQKALEMAVEYSQVRTQFGRPIGSFQALKHMAAEMASEIEPARALVWYAAHVFDARPKEAARAAALAKARLSDVYSRTTNRAVQMHGGIGFTWEHNLHFWFKRAKWNEYAFGDAAFHRERLAQLERF
jgi:alkylation response protein AidB-like acyl-CoA dehydrogenase